MFVLVILVILIILVTEGSILEVVTIVDGKYLLPTGTKYAKGDEVSSVCRERRITLGELSVHGSGPMN